MTDLLRMLEVNPHVRAFRSMAAVLEEEPGLQLPQAADQNGSLWCSTVSHCRTCVASAIRLAPKWPPCLWVAMVCLRTGSWWCIRAATVCGPSAA